MQENIAISFCVMAESLPYDKIFNMILEPDSKENMSDAALPVFQRALRTLPGKSQLPVAP